MQHYKNFDLSTYIYAYDIVNLSEAEIERRLKIFRKNVPLDKIYIENHRGKVDIPVEKLRSIKALCERYDLQTAGGITYTQFVNGIRKPAIFDTYCYTDPAHRADAIRVARELAGVFDEIILDDFFFTACRCEMCIDAKGTRTWAEYRLQMMADFAEKLVAAAKEVNPKLKFVVKYPNWYESYRECGFNPGREKDIFDGIYTGTETRVPESAQHLQRYESYSIMRFMENIAPGRNGGGWVDPFGSLDYIENLYQQLEATLLGKAKELTIWNFHLYSDMPELPEIGKYLYQVDARLSKLGKPMGLAVWEPFDGDAEEQIYNYLGMCGIPLEPTPYFPEEAPTVLFTASTIAAPDSLEKLKTYVRNGGNAIVTTGYYKAMYEKGIRDLSSVTLTGRHVSGKEYRIQNANFWNDVHYVQGDEPVMFEALSYKTNATVCDISVLDGDCNFPVMTEDNYGRGRFFVLNMPENYAAVYKLPAKVLETFGKHMTMGLPLYVGTEAKCSLYAFDNNHYLLRSYDRKERCVKVVVRGESSGLRNIETGELYTGMTPMPLPSHMGDATTLIPEPAEYAYTVNLAPESSLLFEILRDANSSREVKNDEDTDKSLENHKNTVGGGF